MPREWLLHLPSDALPEQPRAAPRRDRGLLRGRRGLRRRVPRLLPERQHRRGGGSGDYSWHATQEHWWFSQGTTFRNVIIVLLIVLALISLSNSSNPGETHEEQRKIIYSGFVNTRVCLGGLRDVIDLKGLGP